MGISTMMKRMMKKINFVAFAGYVFLGASGARSEDTLPVAGPTPSSASTSAANAATALLNSSQNAAQLPAASAAGSASTDKIAAPLVSDSSAPAPTASAPGRIYISVGDPNLKKVLIGIEPTGGMSPQANSFYQALTSDMDFTDYFELLPPSRLPAIQGGMILGSFRFDHYKALGTEFLIKSRLEEKNGSYEAELRLYDVNSGAQILGRLYPLVGKVDQPGKELAHYAANDVIKALTGEDGIFRTRIIASCGNRTKEIYIMDFDGGNLRQLTKDRNFALSPKWAPDGKRIVFTSYRPSTKGGFVNPNLYMYNVLTQERTVLSSTKGLNTGGSFHPKENKIAYTFSVNARPEIYVLDLDSKVRYPITKTTYFSVEPSWAPDGNQITYSSSKTGNPHIYVANADGSASRRLTFAGVYNSSPDWSPRGDRIAFSGQENRRNNFNIFMIDPGGSNLERLTSASHSSENPVFSPDGRYVAFSSNEGGVYQIRVMPVRGGRIRVLPTKGLGHCKQPSWSPRL
jgi:TolB protein